MRTQIFESTDNLQQEALCAVVPNNRSSDNNPPLIYSLEHFSIYFICTVMYSNKGNNIAYAAARGTNSVTELRQRWRDEVLTLEKRPRDNQQIGEVQSGHQKYQNTGNL